MTSMIIYVVLFFAFSSFALAVSTNYNHKTLVEKGEIWVNEEASKLQINLLASARESEDVSNIAGKIVFSNDDEYRYDSDKKKIYKNDGLCISDVEEFEVISGANLSSINNGNVEKYDTNLSVVGVRLKITKYSISKEFEMYITAGDGLND